VHPILLQIGPITISTYTALIAVGAAVGLAALYWRAPAGKRTRWLDAGLAAMVGGLIGARLVYVAANADYYLPHLEEVIQLWQGGLAWPGAPLGALAGAWIYSRRTGEALGPILDALAVPIVLLSVLGWGGCMAAGCAYGYEVAPGQLPAWLTSYAPDLFGIVALRFATQALGIGLSLLALAAVAGLPRARKWAAGAHGLYALSLVAVIMFGLSFTRGDPTPLVRGYRLDSVGGAIVLLAATGLWLLRLRGAPGNAAGVTSAPDAPAAPADTITQP
jgi:phosphatidylglycerol:prolipoprotein diacylglycerol transferase